MIQFVRLASFGALVAGFLAMVVPTEVVAQKKKAPAADAWPAATPDDYKAIQNRKEITGKFVSADAGNVTLRVEYPHQEANPKYKPTANSPQANLMRQYTTAMQSAAKAKTPQQAAMAQQNLARIQQQMMAMAAGKTADPNNQPFITVTNTKDFEFEIKEGASVRKMFLPFEYDDTGNPKTYTAKEKQELQGTDRSKPGYMAKVEELQPNMEVKLTLAAPPKKKKEAAPPPKSDDKDAAPAAADAVPRPIVTMILATKDVPGTGIAGAAPDAPKKKKNN